MAATAAALLLIRRRGCGSAPPSAMMRSLLRGSYSTAAVGTLPVSHRVHLASPSLLSLLRCYSSKGPTMEADAGEFLKMMHVYGEIRRNLDNNGHSLLDQVKNLEERAEMLEKPLHKAIDGKESTADLVVQLTGIRKNSKAVRKHLELCSSFENQAWMFLFSHMHRFPGFLIKSAMVVVATFIVTVVMPMTRLVCKWE